MDKLFYLLTEGTIGKKVRIDSACAYHVGTDLRNSNQYLRKEGRFKENTGTWTMTEPIISLYIRKDDLAKFLGPPRLVPPEKLFCDLPHSKCAH